MSSVSGSGERLLAILDLFTEARPEWTPEEMMSALGYSRPTLYRYLKTIREAGFLVSLPGQGYTLGPRVTELDYLMSRSDPLVAESGPVLKRLAARHPASVFVTRWYGRKILCVASEVSNPAPKSSYPRGRPMPLGRGAISRVILANLPKKQQMELLADLPEAGIEVADLAPVRQTGVSIAYGEVTEGVVGVAAAILTEDRVPIAALCVTSNLADVDDARLTEIARDVRAAARQITDALRGDIAQSA